METVRFGKYGTINLADLTTLIRQWYLHSTWILDVTFGAKSSPLWTGTKALEKCSTRFIFIDPGLN